jgi:4-hydroxybenzoate polyprenyltransferase
VVRELRVYQWPKNLFVFAALIFAQQLDDSTQAFRSLLAFAAFCAASSAAYVFNDLADIEKDRAHPKKRHRPLASGALSPRAAVVIILVLAVITAALGYLLGEPFMGILLLYLLLTASYSLVLKNLHIVDVLALSTGFVLRAMGGAIALDVDFSSWLVVCTLFLALFLSLSKRRHEVELLKQSNAPAHRHVLQYYNVEYLDHLIVIVISATIITYTIYTCSPDVVHRLGTDKLYLTLPFVIYGLFRYLYLVHYQEGGGDPTKTLLKDWPLGVTILLYGLACVVIIYGHSQF